MEGYAVGCGGGSEGEIVTERALFVSAVISCAAQRGERGTGSLNPPPAEPSGGDARLNAYGLITPF